MGTTAAAIADPVTGASVRDLPPSAMALVRRAFLDTIAVTLLGARMAAPRTVAAVEFVRTGSARPSLRCCDGAQE